jgi:C1A family cysteine protease
MDRISLPGKTEPTGMGWIPDRPDVRDLTSGSDRVRSLLESSGSKSLQLLARRSADAADGEDAALPPSTDLRQWFSPVEDQGHLGSCTANAACGIVEYYQRRTFGKYIDMSRLFLYKATREYLGMTGDTGAHLRSTMGALALFGVPPERYWPYDISRFDEEPSAFSFAFAQSYQALTYFRLDAKGASPEHVLGEVRTHLGAGVPAMFGFTVYASIRNPNKPGDIPFPSHGEEALGGHAIVAVGYDDARAVENPLDGQVRTGAFLIRNSWGSSWGESGYGWLPYEYVRQGLAEDWWSMTAGEWVESSAFDE